jgi:DNA invertase Pin-like site-specific DNA recombinase
MTALAEFERDLLRERVRSGIAAARRRGVVFGRRPHQGRGVKLFYQRLTQSLDGDGCAELAAISLIILRL